MKIDKSVQAFPNTAPGTQGMTLRDYFAAHAPDAPPDFAWNDDESLSFQRMSRWSYVYADAMLAERAK